MRPDIYPRQCYLTLKSFDNADEPVGLLRINNYCFKMVLVVVGYRKKLRIAMTVMLFPSVMSKIEIKNIMDILH